ncbi:MAG: phosphate-binding protein, partial [Gammaproteobacteria bacterium]
SVVDATHENAINGSYPLARFLYVYVNKPPNKPLPPLEREFIKMILSKQGQTVVVKNGYVPLPAQVASIELENITDKQVASFK